MIVNRGPGLTKILQHLESFDIVCLGLVMEKPRRVKDLIELLRTKKKVDRSVGRMLKMQVLVEESGGILRYEPQTLLKTIRDGYLAKAEKADRQIRKYLDVFPFRCSCGEVSLQEKCGKCGSDAEPVSRYSVVKPFERATVAFKREAALISRLV